MTRIAERKTRLRAETSAVVRQRPLIVELDADGYGLTIRERGRRTGYAVSWTSIFVLGATQAANQRRAERAARQKARRA